MKQDTQSAQVQANNGREFTGKVLSAKMNKTIIVGVEKSKNHPIYKKATRSIKRLAVHCEDTTIKAGDTVTVTEIKPMSKTKHFRFVEKVR